MLAKHHRLYYSIINIFSNFWTVFYHWTRNPKCMAYISHRCSLYCSWIFWVFFTVSRYQTPCINNWVPVAAGQTVLIDGLMAIMVLFTPLTQLLVAANSWERHYAVSQTPWLVSTRLTIRGNLASGVGCKVFKCVLMLIGLFSIDKSRLHIIWILK